MLPNFKTHVKCLKDDGGNIVRRQHRQGGQMLVRKKKITTRLFIDIMLIVLLGDLVLGLLIDKKVSDSLIKQIGSGAKDIAICAAQNVDATDFLGAIEEGMDSDSYARVNAELSNFLKGDQVKYIYSFAKDDRGGVHFVVDTDIEDASDVWESYESDDYIEQAFAGEAVADKEKSTDEWGSYLSAYAPIIDNGKVIGVVGVDVDYSMVAEKTGEVTIYIIIICAALAIVVFIALTIICARLKAGFEVLNRKVEELSDG